MVTLGEKLARDLQQVMDLTAASHSIRAYSIQVFALARYVPPLQFNASGRWHPRA
jgi:hypothetical protein